MADPNLTRIKKLSSNIKEKGSRNETDRAKAGDLEYFWTWAELVYGKTESYPVDPMMLLDFVVSHLEGDFPAGVDQALVKTKIKSQLGKHKLSTIRRRISSLSWKHKELNFHAEKNPTKHSEVASVLKHAANDRAHVSTPSKAAVKRTLDTVLASIQGDDFHSLRDRALLAVTWQSGRRRSETVGMQIEHRLETVPSRPGSSGYFIFEFPTMKNRKRTDDALTVKVGGRTKDYLEAWINAAQIKHGPIFRGITKHGKTILETAITGTQMYRIVKKHFLNAGIEDWEHFTPHSFRSGFVTELGKQNISVGDGMALTGHKSLKTFMGYYQAGSAETNTAADLLDE